MSKNRYQKKVDSNQPLIVKQLREMGMSVELDKDDILVGANGKTYWFEIKAPECVSKRTGKILTSAKKPNQIELESGWKGHYHIVSSLEEILEDINGE